MSTDPIATFLADAPEQQDTAEHLADLALSEPDAEYDCLRCRRTMAPPDRSEGEEPTPLCHYCAQAALPVLAVEVRRLREREVRLVHERECLGTAIADAAYKAGISNGLPMTGPELILMTQEMADAIRRGQERAERIEADHCRRQLLGEMAVADVVDGLLEEEA